MNGNVDDVMSNLSVIAEACPETVMELLTKDIKSSESVVVPFLKTYRYSCVLHALGVLCTFDNTKIQACNLLFDLMDFKCSTAYSNSPKNSLLTALCLWYNEGALSLEEKVKIVKKYLMIAPLKAAYLTTDFWSDVLALRCQRRLNLLILITPKGGNTLAVPATRGDYFSGRWNAKNKAVR